MHKKNGNPSAGVREQQAKQGHIVYSQSGNDFLSQNKT